MEIHARCLKFALCNSGPVVLNSLEGTVDVFLLASLNPFDSIAIDNLTLLATNPAAFSFILEKT
jgi:hypothetical protein